MNVRTQAHGIDDFFFFLSRYKWERKGIGRADERERDSETVRLAMKLN